MKTLTGTCTNCRTYRQSFRFSIQADLVMSHQIIHYTLSVCRLFSCFPYSAVPATVPFLPLCYRGYIDACLLKRIFDFPILHLVCICLDIQLRRTSLAHLSSLSNQVQNFILVCSCSSVFTSLQKFSEYSSIYYSFCTDLYPSPARNVYCLVCHFFHSALRAPYKHSFVYEL